MYRLIKFLDDIEAIAQKTIAKKEYHIDCSRASLVLQEDLVRFKLFHLDDKGGESQEPDNRFESKESKQ